MGNTEAGVNGRIPRAQPALRRHRLWGRGRQHCTGRTAQAAHSSVGVIEVEELSAWHRTGRARSELRIGSAWADAVLGFNLTTEFRSVGRGPYKLGQIQFRMSCGADEPSAVPVAHGWALGAES
jgi:hypothetical protein